MTETEQPPSLEALRDKIAAARKTANPDEGGGRGKGSHATLRSGTELIAGIAVGGFLGYHADNWLDTRPALVIAGIFLGMAGGVMNIYRAVSTEAKHMEQSPGDPSGKPDGNDKSEGA